MHVQVLRGALAIVPCRRTEIHLRECLPRLLLHYAAQPILPTCSTVAHPCQTGMPFQDQAGRYFGERGTKKPTAGGIQFSAFLKRLNSQDNGAVTLRGGEEGHRLPECLDASIGTTQEGQIRPGNAELDGDFAWYGTGGSVGKMQCGFCAPG